VLNPVVSAAKI